MENYTTPKNHRHMDIKQQLIKEIELRKALRPKDGKKTYINIAKEAGISYSGLMRWVNTPGRSISSITLEKIAKPLGKRIIIIDDN